MPRGPLLAPVASLLVVSPGASAALAATQSFTLSFGSLPSAHGMTYVPSGSHTGTAEAKVFSVSGGTLTQDSMGLGYGVSGGTVQLPGTCANTTFHEYVLEFTPPATRCIYRDGTLIHTSTSGFGVAASRIFFGDATGGVASALSGAAPASGGGRSPRS